MYEFLWLAGAVGSTSINEKGSLLILLLFFFCFFGSEDKSEISMRYVPSAIAWRIASTLLTYNEGE